MTEIGGAQRTVWSGSSSMLRVAIGVSLVFLMLGFVSVVCET